MTTIPAAGFSTSIILLAERVCAELSERDIASKDSCAPLPFFSASNWLFTTKFSVLGTTVTVADVKIIEKENKRKRKQTTAKIQIKFFDVCFGSMFEETLEMDK